MNYKGRIIGHRGAAGYAPENTIVAFNKAMALGCQYIEFDVMCTADGEPFVIHDENLKRTTNGKGEVGQVSAHYMQSLDAGRWFSRKFAGEKVPHFQDVLVWLNFSGMQANIEIKPWSGKTEETTVTVLRYINSYWPQNKPLPLVSCFDRNALELCQSIAPEMPLGLLVDTWKEDCVEQAQKYHCFSIHVNKKLVTVERVKKIKDAGFQAYAYTINSKRQAKKLLDMGVDAIFSDYPDLL